jgi:hypothetical protein
MVATLRRGGDIRAPGPIIGTRKEWGTRFRRCGHGYPRPRGLSIVIDVFQRRLGEAAAVTDLSVFELWLRYATLTGTADCVEIEGYIAGLTTLPDHEHNVLAVAVNECLSQLGYLPAALYKVAPD